MMERGVYDRLVAVRLQWHSLEMKEELLLLDIPVGIPLIRILDHFVFGLGCGIGGKAVGSGSSLLSRVLIWGAAIWRDCWDTEGPPVTTRFPFAVYLTAASVACGGEIAASPLIRALYKTSSFTWFSFVRPKCTRSTRRLGLGGLALAIAKKVQLGGFWGVEGVCLLLLAVSFLLEVGEGGAFFHGVNGLG